MNGKPASLFQLVICLLFLGLLSTLVYFPTLSSTFLLWDDSTVILENPLIQELSLESLRKMFTTPCLNIFSPLSFLSYAVEKHFFGFDSFVFHTSNLVWHILSVFLVLWLAFLLTDDWLVAMTTATLFAIHPLQVETVAWVNERRNVIYGLFFWASAISYLQYLRKPCWRWLSTALACQLLSGLSKGLAFTLPLIFLLIDDLMDKKVNRQTLAGKIPFFLVSLFLAGIGLFAAHEAFQPRPLIQRIFIASAGICFSLSKLLLPINLYFSYPIPNPLPWIYQAAPWGLVLMLTTVVFLRKKTRLPFWGLTFFFINILPVSGLLPLGIGFLAEDHNAYLPSFGVFLPLACGCRAVLNTLQDRPGLRKIALAMGCVWLLSLAVMSNAQCRKWENTVTFLEDVLRNNPEALFAHKIMGPIYLTMENWPKALTAFDHVTRDLPRFAEGWQGRGNARFGMRDFRGALRDYDQALLLEPLSPVFLFNRGCVFLELGQYEHAVRDFTHSLQSDQANMGTRKNLALAYILSGNPEKGIAELTEVLHLVPTDLQALGSRMSLHVRQRHFLQAWSDFSRLWSQSPRMSVETLVHSLF